MRLCEYPHKPCAHKATEANPLANDDAPRLCARHAKLAAQQAAQNSC